MTAPIDDEPMPVSRERLWGVGIATFVVLVVASWTLWDRIAWRRFQEEVARVRASGEPVWETDFPASQIPDNENAAMLLRRAGTEVVERPERRSDDFLDPPLTPDAVELLGSALAANHDVLADVRLAERLPAVYWGRWPTNDPADFPLWHRTVEDLRQQRTLAWQLVYASRHAHAVGDDRAAVQYVRDIFFLGTAGESRGTVVAYRLNEGTYAKGVFELELLAPELRIGDGAGQMPFSEVRDVIAGLLDASGRRQWLIVALQHERDAIVAPATAEFARQFRHIADQEPWRDTPPHDVAPAYLDGAADWLARPFMLMNAARQLHYCVELSNAARAADGDETLPPPPAQPDESGSAMFGVHWIVTIRWERYGVNSGVTRSFAILRSITRDSTHAAIALATRLYQTDHGAQMPATVATLMPKYLPFLPSGVTPTSTPAYYVSTKARPAALPTTGPLPKH